MELSEIARRVRINILKTVHDAGSGHVAGPMGIADLLTYLYFQELNIFPDKPNNPKRDRFVLSCAHMVPALYAVLAERGFISHSQLPTLREFGSPLQGHTFRNLDIGVETTGGSLGQGISVAMGMALAASQKNESHKVYCLISDGETNEGSVWEAAMFGAKHKLSNFVLILDNNGIQQSGTNEEIMPMGSLADKWSAFGWQVFEIDGHDFMQMQFTFGKLMLAPKPTIIISHTTPGKGVDFMENKYEWHGKAPTDAELEKALKQLR